MLNLYRQIISNNLNNTICEELPDEWLERLSPGIRNELVNGFYNAGILTINLADFNRNEFYDKTAKLDFKFYCEDLYQYIAPTIQKCLRRMFLGFNDNLAEYKVVLFMEGRDEDHLEAIKFNIDIF